jgi:YHS domain-containing protein
MVARVRTDTERRPGAVRKGPSESEEGHDPSRTERNVGNGAARRAALTGGGLVTLLAIGHTATDALTSSVTALLPAIQARFSLTETALALLVAALAFSASVTQPVFGALADRLGRRPVAALGIILAAVLISLVAVVPTLSLLVILLLIGGLGSAALHPTGASIARAAGGRNPGLAVSLFGAAGTVGMALGPVVVLAIVASFGFGATPWLMIPGVVLGSLLLVVMPPQERCSYDGCPKLVDLRLAVRPVERRALALSLCVCAPCACGEACACTAQVSDTADADGGGGAAVGMAQVTAGAEGLRRSSRRAIRRWIHGTNPLSRRCSGMERPAMTVDRHEHSPGQTGCPTCDAQDGQPAPVRGRGISAVRVQARGKYFRIVQLLGNLFVCSKANGNCCCGWAEKGRMPFDNSLWSEEWDRRRIRNRLHLTFTGCLGPCAVGNNALLQLHGRSIWFKDLNDAALVPAVFDYAETMLTAGQVLAPPERLHDHVYERYLPSPAVSYEPLVGDTTQTAAGLDRLDPVCLMEVDPATARHTVEYNGRTIAFCAPSCKKQFLSDPDAFVAAAAP